MATNQKLTRREEAALDAENTGSADRRAAVVRGRAIQAETGHVTRGGARLGSRDRGDGDVHEGAPWRRGSR
jgi:hypothetical protein